MSRFFGKHRVVQAAFAAAVSIFFLTASAPASRAEEPLRIGYSDWPGYVAWQVAIDKGWLKEADLNVTFEWFDYSAEMDAFSAGKLDAAQVTNGDMLVMSSNGAKSVVVSMLDYSDGNDVIIAKPGVKSLVDLRGKKIGVEIGLVDHLLLLNGLKDAGMQESDVELINSKTNELPQVLASGDVDAVSVWEPVATTVLKISPGSTRIYDSAAVPGLIYDVIVVSPQSLAARRAEWVRIVRLWERVVAYIQDPATQADATKIMADKVGISPEAYTALQKGTKLLSLAEGRKLMAGKEDGLGSLSGSNQIVDAFNVKNYIYKQPQTATVDLSLVDEALGKFSK